MRSATYSMFFLALFLHSHVLKAQPSRVEKRSFSSNALGLTKNYNVYLPEGYDTSTGRYPVAYYLRGHEFELFDPALPGRVGGKTLKDVADDLIATGRIGKMIIVCPSTASEDYDITVHSCGVNMLRPNFRAAAGIGTGRFEDYFIQDLIPHIDATLRTIADREHRAIDGFSLGGYNSTMLSLKHPDLFISVGSYDGTIMWYNLDDPNIPGANIDDPIWSSTYFDPVFDRPHNSPYMLLHSASNMLRAADAMQLTNFQTMRFHISTVMADTVGNLSRNLQLISIFREKGMRSSFSNPTLASNAVHNYGFFDQYAAITLVRHWQAFNGYRLNAPLAIDFGVIPAGEKDTTNIVLFNYSTTPLTISSASNPNTGYNLLNLPALPQTLPRKYDTLGFKVVFNASAHRVFTDTLFIASNDNANPRARIALRGRGLFLGQAQAGVAYATGGTITQLFSVNRANGVSTAIGSTSTFAVRGLAIHPVTKEIYATVPSDVKTALYRLSSKYGEALAITNIPIGQIWGIAFQPDGTLFGVTTAGRLYRINPSNGEATPIGASTGVPYSGLSFNPTTGKLYTSTTSRFDRIYTVNSNTGSAKLVGSTGFGVNVPGIAFSSDGVLYGVTSANNFIRIDTTNAAGTLIGSTGFTQVYALAMRTDSPTVSVADRTQSTLPEVYSLNQNYPNPFNPATTIAYHLPRAGEVKLLVYNLAGQLVRTLIDAPQAAGRFQINWDGKDDVGNGVASGVYLYRLEAGNFAETKKMILMR